MTHYYVSSTATVPMVLMYKCSKCGRVNFPVVKISHTGYGGTTTRSSNINGLGSAANVGASLGLDHAAERILFCMEYGNYQPLGADHACTKCGHREPWSKFVTNFSKFWEALLQEIGALLFIGFTILCAAFAIVYCLCVGPYWGSLIGLGYIACYAAYFLYAELKNKYLQKKVKQLPQESHPIFLKFGSLDD